MKKLVEFSVAHPVTTSMMCAVLILLGGLALFRLESALLPEVSYPRLTVVTRYADESPSGMEERVGKPIEEALSGVRGLIRTRSSSAQGVNVVRLVFDWKSASDINFAAMEAREKLDLIRNLLPQEAERPVVLKYDPNAAPLLNISCIPRNADDRGLRRFVERNVKPLLQRVEGVGGVKVSGGHIPEIQVAVDPGKLFALQMTLSDMVQMIARANFNTPAGPLSEGTREVMVRTIGEFAAPGEIGDIIVPGRDGAGFFRLSALASIRTGYRDRRSETLFDTTAGIGISVFTESGANQVATAERVRTALQEIGEKFAGRLRFETVVDRSEYIRSAVSAVAWAALIGGVLAFFVLLAFLGSVFDALILVLSLPVCTAATLFLMFLAGITLNVISLGGLALGLGMTVDSGIVVVENIRRRLERGEGRREAVVNGAGEMSGAVFASNLTSIAVFLPIVFVTGLSGRLFGQMALTVSFSLLVSIVTALSIIPTALYRLKGTATRAPASRLRKPQPGGAFLERFLKRTMRMKKRVLTTAFLVFVASVPVFLVLGRGFLPPGARKTVKAEVYYPADMNLERRVEIYHRFVSRVRATLPGVRLFAEVGVDEEDPTAAAADRNPASAEIMIALDEQEPEGAATRLRAAFADWFDTPYVIEADTTLIEGVEGGHADRLTVNLGGSDESLKNAAPLFLEGLRRFPEIERVSAAGLETREEIQVRIDRRLSASLGVTVRDVAAAVRMSLGGEVATELKQGDRRTDVRVRFEEGHRRRETDLAKIFVRSGAGALLPLSQLAAFERDAAESRLFRDNGRRVHRYQVMMRAGHDQRDAAFRERLREAAQRHGAELDIEGEDQEGENLRGLLFAFLLAIVLIYMVLASQFESYGMPLVVMASLPLAAVGSLALLAVTGTSLNVISAMGMVMLVGIAVNNAIVMEERFSTLLGEGRSPDAAACEAAAERTRPILMTTGTTLLGMLPLAVGGATLQRDLALAVIGGLASSTILTLCLLPVFFSRFGGGRR